MLPRIKEAQYQGDYRVLLIFSNGASGIVDLRNDVVNKSGLFRPLSDAAYFSKVSVDAEAGTLVWPNGLDLDPDVLYHRATGEPLPATEPVAERR